MSLIATVSRNIRIRNQCLQRFILIPPKDLCQQIADIQEVTQTKCIVFNILNDFRLKSANVPVINVDQRFMFPSGRTAAGTCLFAGFCVSSRHPL